MTNLVTAEKMKTHRITFKLEDGTYRQFLLNPNQARVISQSLNSVEQFVVLPPDIDKNAPSAYPKRGAWLEKLDDEEREAIMRRHRTRREPTEEDLEAERVKAARSKAIRGWIAAHPAEFAELEGKARDKLHAAPGMFQSASKGTKQSLVKYEAMRAVDELITASQSGTDANKKS